ncbi:Uncharacterised protein [Mycobacterium tuberculosis]|nr:Uncharacterised protein [Mycobacterium tuberculosis]
MDQAWVKVAIGICSSRPLGVPLSLRCTTLLAVSTPVTTTAWSAWVRWPWPAG